MSKQPAPKLSLLTEGRNGVHLDIPNPTGKRIRIRLPRRLAIVLLLLYRELPPPTEQGGHPGDAEEDETTGRVSGRDLLDAYTGVTKYPLEAKVIQRYVWLINCAVTAALEKLDALTPHGGRRARAKVINFDDGYKLNLPGLVLCPVLSKADLHDDRVLRTLFALRMFELS